MDADKQINKDNCRFIIKNKNDNNTNKFIPQLLNGKSETLVNNHWTKEEDDIIIKNKNINISYKFIATLLNGKSENQVRTRSSKLIGTLDRKACTWTKEEEDIIIKNKIEKKINKDIAMLLEGKSESQVKNHSIILTEIGKLDRIFRKGSITWTKEEDDIIIENKNNKKTNKDIAMLLEGKSECQVKNRSRFLINEGNLDRTRKGCTWTKEEDVIIIENKTNKKTNKDIAMLLEGKSEAQVQYHCKILTAKGTLKTVAKKKEAPVMKTRIAPKASKFRFTVKQKYKPTSNKKQKLMDERVENLSEEVVDSKTNCIPVCTKSIYNMPSLASNKFHQNPPPPDSSDSSSDNDSSDNDSSDDSSSDESSDGSSDDEDDNDNCIPVCTTSIYDMPSSVSDIFHLRRPILSLNQLSSKGIIPDGTSSLFKMPSSVSDKFHLHLSSTKPDDDLFGFNFDFENDSLPHH